VYILANNNKFNPEWKELYEDGKIETPRIATKRTESPK